MKPANYQQRQAFILIELISQWEGQLTTGPLMQHFGVSRSTASGLIKAYRMANANALHYNAPQKSYQPTATFAPAFSQCSLEEYSQYCLDQQKDSCYLCTITTDTPRFFTGLQRKPKPDIVRAIIQAIKNQQRLDIAYASLSSPEFAERIISPHTLVFDGYRWHVRAFCEKNQSYRDFVLARINQVFAQEGPARQGRQGDSAWHNNLSFNIEPDPRFDNARQRIIAIDYGMQQEANGRWYKTYQATEAMLLYWLQYLRVDNHRDTAEAQQIILSPASRKALARYLPKY